MSELPSMMSGALSSVALGNRRLVFRALSTTQGNPADRAHLGNSLLNHSLGRHSLAVDGWGSQPLRDEVPLVTLWKVAMINCSH